MERYRLHRLLRALIAAFVLVTVPGLRHGTVIGLTSDASVAPQAPVSATRCGRVDTGSKPDGWFYYKGGLFGLVDSVDPVVRDAFDVAGRTYASADFHLVTLAIFELAWIAHQEVCIDEDVEQKPVGASATVDFCGDAVAGATVWLFQTGLGELDPNGQTNERTGFIHDTLMGFEAGRFGGDPRPPNFFNALRVAIDYTEPDDCIAASVSWSAPADPVVAASVMATECLIAGDIDGRAATFIQPANDWTYTFSLTPGSSISPVFEPGELGAVAVTARRGLDGSVAIAPVRLDGCPDARASAPNQTPAPTPTPTPGPTTSPAPSPPPSPSPSATSAAIQSPAGSDAPTGGGIAAGLESTDPGSGSLAAPAGASSDLPILGLLVAAFLAAGGVGVFWRFVLRRPRLVAGSDALALEAVELPAPTAAFRLEKVGLTPREKEVLAMVAGGLTNREIGAALYITESTAGVHVSNILGKLGVESRTEAARYALEGGIEPSGPIGPVH